MPTHQIKGMQKPPPPFLIRYSVSSFQKKISGNFCTQLINNVSVSITFWKLNHKIQYPIEKKNFTFYFESTPLKALI